MKHGDKAMMSEGRCGGGSWLKHAGNPHRKGNDDGSYKGKSKDGMKHRSKAASNPGSHNPY